MNTSDGMFGQTLATWLEEDAEHRVSDHLGEVLIRSVSTRQRAWWSSPERWLPVDTTPNLGSRLSLPRAAIVLALIAVALLALAGTALVTGALRPFAPTIGVTTNGRILVADGGSLLSYAADGTDRQVVRSLDASASDLRFSPDGHRLAYIVAAPSRRIEILDLGTSKTTQIAVPNSTDLAGPLDWSPDGRNVVFGSTDGVHESIGTASTDGSGSHVIDTSAITPSGRWIAGWSPQGDQIAFVAGDPDSGIGTIYVVRPDGSDLHAVTQTPALGGSVSWSPDPTVHRLLYTQDGNHVQFVDAATGSTAPVVDAFWPTWSPTGDRISTWQSVVYRTADVLANAPQPTDLLSKWSGGGCADHQDLKDRSFCGPMSWSPDGTRVYAPDITGTSILSVVADGTGKPFTIPLSTNVTDVADPAAWQPVIR